MPLTATTRQVVTPALQTQRTFMEGDRTICAIHFFFDNQPLTFKIRKGLIICAVAILQARALNMPRARIFKNFHDFVSSRLDIWGLSQT
jgi:hypothetical protein